MTKASVKTGEGSATKTGNAARTVDADPFGIAEWMKDMPSVPLHPLLSHPTAAVAAATALGFGITSQVAGAMFGAMQGAMDAIQKTAREQDEKSAVKPAQVKAAAAAEKLDVQAPPAKAQPAAKVARAPAARKPAARKPLAVKKVAVAAAQTAPAASGASDLKQISGIGPKLEQALNGMGIKGLADMAALTAKRAARIDEELGLGGRIARDDWAGQAKKLLAGD